MKIKLICVLSISMLVGCTSLSTYRTERYDPLDYRERLTAEQVRVIYRDRMDHEDAYRSQQDQLDLIRSIIENIGYVKYLFNGRY